MAVRTLPEEVSVEIKHLGHMELREGQNLTSRSGVKYALWEMYTCASLSNILGDASLQVSSTSLYSLSSNFIYPFSLNGVSKLGHSWRNYHVIKDCPFLSHLEHPSRCLQIVCVVHVTLGKSIWFGRVISIFNWLNVLILLRTWDSSYIPLDIQIVVSEKRLLYHNGVFRTFHFRFLPSPSSAYARIEGQSGSEHRTTRTSQHIAEQMWKLWIHRVIDQGKIYLCLSYLPMWLKWDSCAAR